MKYFAVVVVLAHIALSQISAQVIRSSSPCVANTPNLVPNLVTGPFVTGPAPVLAPPCAAPAPIYASPQVYAAPQQVYAPQPVYTVPSSDVAGSLADTLSLLTVSSLLAEKLPLGYPPVVSNVGGCGCGYTQLGGYYL